MNLMEAMIRQIFVFFCGKMDKLIERRKMNFNMKWSLILIEINMFKVQNKNEKLCEYCYYDHCVYSVIV